MYSFIEIKFLIVIVCQVLLSGFRESLIYYMQPKFDINAYSLTFNALRKILMLMLKYEDFI